MNRLKSIITAIIFLTPLVALATPGIPHQFYGNVVFESGATPDGLLVEAKVNGTVVGSSVTKDGKYGINPSLLFASKTEGDWSGETVTFFVDGTNTGESFALVKGGYTNLPLTVSGVAPGGTTTPTPIPSPTPTPNNNSNSGENFNITPTPTPQVLGATTQAVDANNDGKIDVLDFNTLMVNWGSTSGDNVADFNGDGKVDVFDFNLLMINWTL